MRGGEDATDVRLDVVEAALHGALLDVPLFDDAERVTHFHECLAFARGGGVVLAEQLVDWNEFFTFKQPPDGLLLERLESWGERVGVEEGRQASVVIRVRV